LYRISVLGTENCKTHNNQKKNCKKARKKDDSDVAIGVNCGIIASSSSWSKFVCNLRTDITSIPALEGSPRLLPPSRGEHCEHEHGQAPSFPHGWCKIAGFTRIPHYDWPNTPL
jgi:hypothetical protein